MLKESYHTREMLKGIKVIDKDKERGREMRGVSPPLFYPIKSMVLGRYSFFWKGLGIFITPSQI